jgi:hypothetical protein
MEVRYAWMADDPTKKGAADRTRVNVEEDHELRYWSERYYVTPERLKEAVKKVGVLVKDVENELAG